MHSTLHGANKDCSIRSLLAVLHGIMTTQNSTLSHTRHGTPSSKGHAAKDERKVFFSLVSSRKNETKFSGEVLSKKKSGEEQCPCSEATSCSVAQQMLSNCPPVNFAQQFRNQNLSPRSERAELHVSEDSPNSPLDSSSRSELNQI